MYRTNSTLAGNVCRYAIQMSFCNTVFVHLSKKMDPYFRFKRQTRIITERGSLGYYPGSRRSAAKQTADKIRAATEQHGSSTYIAVPSTSWQNNNESSHSSTSYTPEAAPVEIVDDWEPGGPRGLKTEYNISSRPTL